MATPGRHYPNRLCSENQITFFKEPGVSCPRIWVANALFHLTPWQFGLAVWTLVGAFPMLQSWSANAKKNTDPNHFRDDSPLPGTMITDLNEVGNSRG